MTTTENREGRTASEAELAKAVMSRVDGFFFVFSAISAIWLAFLLLRDGVHAGWQLSLLVVFWFFFSYLLVPRVHSILTRLYVPPYFMGRTRTSDGRLGDPVNLALLGREAQLHRAMTDSGWTRADDLSWRTGVRIVTSTLRRRSYPEAPVSPLILLGSRQEFAYQREVAGNPARRHHVRFFRCPPGWMLPGGYDVDWLAAGTYDKSVGVSLFTLQVTHKIESNTDLERDYILESMRQADSAIDVRMIEDYSTGYFARNGGGDRIETDGHLPIVDLRRLAVAGLSDDPDPDWMAPEEVPTGPPAATIFGAGIAAVRAVTYLVGAAAVYFSSAFIDSAARHAWAVTSGVDDDTLRYAASSVLVVAALVDIVLGISTLVGKNWARLVLMSACVFTTVVTFMAEVRGADQVTLAHLPTVGGSILVLLALSSAPAREYATGDTDNIYARATREAVRVANERRAER